MTKTRLKHDLVDGATPKVAEFLIKRLPRLARSMDEQCQEHLRAHLSGVGPVEECCQFVSGHEGDHITSKGRRWKNRNDG